MKRVIVLVAVFILALSTSLFAQSECDQAQKAFDQLSIKDSVSWESLQQSFPKPFLTRSTVSGGKVGTVIYMYKDCYAYFSVNSEGIVTGKKFMLGTYPLPGHSQLPESWHPKYIPLQGN
jgi:hypothetical protein